MIVSDTRKILIYRSCGSFLSALLVGIVFVHADVDEIASFIQVIFIFQIGLQVTTAGLVPAIFRLRVLNNSRSLGDVFIYCLINSCAYVLLLLYVKSSFDSGIIFLKDSSNLLWLFIAILASSVFVSTAGWMRGKASDSSLELLLSMVRPLIGLLTFILCFYVLLLDSSLSYICAAIVSGAFTMTLLSRLLNQVDVGFGSPLRSYAIILKTAFLPACQSILRGYFGKLAILLIGVNSQAKEILAIGVAYQSVSYVQQLVVAMCHQHGHRIIASADNYRSRANEITKFLAQLKKTSRAALLLLPAIVAFYVQWKVDELEMTVLAFAFSSLLLIDIAFAGSLYVSLLLGPRKLVFWSLCVLSGALIALIPARVYGVSVSFLLVVELFVLVALLLPASVVIKRTFLDPDKTSQS